jgi:calcineurin-like phosphoesterase family protein
MNEWLFTDPHYHHRMLVETGKRPEGFESLIDESWKRLVLPQDKVYCLGDVCMGDKVKVHTEHVESMPGWKILILGNHDKQKPQWYLEHGWNEVHEKLMLKRPWRVLLSHKPQIDDESYDMNIHGHFHNDQHRASEPKNIAMRSPKHRLLALECVNYQLIPLQDFIDGKIEQPGLPVTKNE